MLWDKLFVENSRVVVNAPKEYRFSNPVVRSFPAARIHDFVKGLYTKTALAFPTELPLWGGTAFLNDDVRPHPGILPLNLADQAELTRIKTTLAIMIKAHGGFIPADYGGKYALGSSAAMQLDFYQAHQFYAPKGPHFGAKFPMPRLEKPDFDFHQVLTLLGDYPQLMRALGLVFDLEVPFPTSLGHGGDFLLRVTPENPLHDEPSTKITPDTHCQLSPVRKVFAANPSGGLIRNGHLDLSGAEFSVAQVDIDGAALKALNFNNTLLNEHAKPSIKLETTSSAGLPALRSGGLSVLMSDRAETFVGKLVRGGQLDQQLYKPAEQRKIALFAEDVARGYRVDVYDEQEGKWFSLCMRKGSYHLMSYNRLAETPPLAETLKPLDGQVDEGTITVAATSGTDPDAGKDLYLHEALFHWDGWSAVVPWPGKTIRRPVPNGVDNNVDHEPSDFANVLGLKVTFSAAVGSLPRLRFGRSYRLRARIADIAGNSRRLQDDHDTTGASAPTPYLRYEPVPTPALVSHAAYRPGESAERLVIRSWDAQLASPTNETSIRYLLAPRTSIQMAEQHVCIDGPAPITQSTQESKGSWYPELCARDAAQLPEFLHTPEPLGHHPSSTSPLDPSLPFQPHQSEVAVSFDPDKPVAYLPDPLAAGAAVVGLPGADAQTILKIPFRDTEQWPFAANFRIVVLEGPVGYTWDNTARVLTIRLPKAESARVRLSSYLADEQALNSLGIWNWIRESAPPAWLGKLMRIALEGRHWMMSPFRELTFVHAVQRPLLAPTMTNQHESRSAGSSCYTLLGMLHFHGKSTDKINVNAAWNDIVLADDDEAGFTLLARSAEAFHVNIDRPDLDYALAHHQHELGDTLHRQLSYRLTATSRFREYFENDAAREGPDHLDFTTPPTLDRPADFVLDIPSSGRPRSPQIEYIVPSFDWSEEHNDDSTVRRRRGNSLRVYMSGDWYSSGQGELLGVVLGHGPQVKTQDDLSGAEETYLKQSAAPIPPRGLEHFMTRWGLDPIWVGGATYQTPTLHQFPDAVTSGTDLTLSEYPHVITEKPPWRIAVAGHSVAYDRASRLWYCDITVDTGAAYYPFVRLVLARYQPCSVKGVELSRVIVNDCVQTAPDRLVTIRRDPNAPHQVHVAVSGIAPLAAESVRCPSQVIVRAEVRLPDASVPTWVPIAGPWTVLEDRQVTKYTTVWSGSLVLPQTVDAQHYRLVVEEYELLKTDQGRGAAPALLALFQTMELIRKADLWPRLVYSDVIEIDS